MAALGALRPKPASVEHDARRGSAHSRGYGVRWDKTSKGFRREHPLCCCCQANGVVTATTLVDHVIPHRGDMALFWDPKNWQALCDRCHNVIKKRMEALFDAGKIGAELLRLARPLPEFFDKG